MAEEIKLDYWDTDPLEGEVSAAWMLLDWHRSCRVMACGGTVPFAVGEETGRKFLRDEGLEVWLGEHLKNPQTDALLIPIGNEAWFVLPHCYLSTGYLLWVRLPASAGDSLALAESGALGEVRIFDGFPRTCACDRGFDPDAAVLWWDAVGECLPRPDADAERTEMGRLVRAVAALNGIKLTRTYRRHGEVSQIYEEIAQGVQDLPMLTVMLLLAFAAFRACSVPGITLGFEELEEGLAIRLTASELGAAARPEETAEICACRELAEQNQQLFTCSTQKRAMRLMMCCVRKDYALIGVKVKPTITL